MAKNEQDNNDANMASNYGKYTGIVFQMIVIIGIFAAIGYWLDKKLNHTTPWITAILSLLGVCLALYQTIRQLSNK